MFSLTIQFLFFFVLLTSRRQVLLHTDYIACIFFFLHRDLQFVVSWTIDQRIFYCVQYFFFTFYLHMYNLHIRLLYTSIITHMYSKVNYIILFVHPIHGLLLLPPRTYTHIRTYPSRHSNYSFCHTHSLIPFTLHPYTIDSCLSKANNSDIWTWVRAIVIIVRGVVYIGSICTLRHLCYGALEWMRVCVWVCVCV